MIKSVENVPYVNICGPACCATSLLLLCGWMGHYLFIKLQLDRSTSEGHSVPALANHCSAAVKLASLTAAEPRTLQNIYSIYFSNQSNTIRKYVSAL